MLNGTQRTSLLGERGSPSEAPARRRVSNDIIQVLLKDIATGHYAAGARLPNERDLAQHFGVSQPTIREAIRALDAMGLIDVRHGSGAYATGNPTQLVDMALRTLLQLGDASILDVLEIRALLGRYSAQRAASGATEEDIAIITAAAGALQHLDDVGSVSEIARTVVRFQVAFSRAAHNPLLSAMESFLIDLLMQLQLVGREEGLPSWKTYSLAFVEDRARIVESLTNRDEEGLISAMEAYVDHQHAAFIADQRLSSVKVSQVGSMISMLDSVHGAVTLRS